MDEREIGAAPLRRSFSGLVIGMNTVGSLVVLGLVLMINVDALGRSLFNRPMAGVIELVAVSMAVIVFCQLADTIRLAKLTRSDGYVKPLLERGGLVGRTVVALFEVLGAVVMALILYGIVPLLMRSYERGYYIGTRGVFAFPEWPIRAVIVAGATVALVSFLVRAWDVLHPGKSPVVTNTEDPQ